MSKKKIIIIASSIAAALIVAIIVIVSVVVNNQKGYRTIKVYDLDGTTMVTRSDKELNAYKSMSLKSGDKLSVSSSSYVILLLDDDKYVVAKENSVIDLYATGKKKTGKTNIFVETGEVVFDIKNPLLATETFDISSANTVMAIRGTSGSVRNDGNDLTIDLISGTVDLFVNNSTDNSNFVNFSQHFNESITIPIETRTSMSFGTVLGIINDLYNPSEKVTINSFETFVSANQALDNKLTITPIPADIHEQIFNDLKNLGNDEENHKISISNTTQDYTGSPLMFTITLNNTSDKILYSLNDGKAYDQETPPTCVEVGDYPIYFSINYSDGTTVGYMEVLHIVSPKINYSVSDKEIEYSGSTYGLDLQVTTQDVSIKYSSDNGSTYSLSEAPTFSNSGTYTIYYQLTKYGYETVTDHKTLTITKKKYTVSNDDITSSIDYVENNTINTISLANITTLGGVNGVLSWNTPSTTILPGTKNYACTFVPTNSNYETKELNYIVVAKRTEQIPFEITDATLTYNTSPQKMSISSTVNDAIIKYSNDSGNTYTLTEIPSYTNSGEYTIYYQISSDEYNTYESSEPFVIDKADVVFTEKQIVYVKSYTTGLTVDDVTIGVTPSTNVLGNFAWEENTVELDFCEETRTLLFNPTDLNNYNSSSFDITIRMQGDGTDNLPFMVYCIDDFNSLNNKLNNEIFVKQDVSLDFTGVDFTPIGTATEPFIGTYTCSKNASFSNITYSNVSALSSGLFAYAKSSVFDGLIIKNSSFTGTQVGALVGYGTCITATGCSVSDTTIIGTKNVGGLIGYHNGKLNETTKLGDYSVSSSEINSIKISGTNNIGGLVGYNYYASITNSHVESGVVNVLSAQTTSTDPEVLSSVLTVNAGGLLGYGDTMICSDSYSKADIVAISHGNSLGGLIGFIRDGEIASSYSNGNVYNGEALYDMSDFTYSLANLYLTPTAGSFVGTILVEDESGTPNISNCRSYGFLTRNDAAYASDNFSHYSNSFVGLILFKTQTIKFSFNQCFATETCLESWGTYATTQITNANSVSYSSPTNAYLLDGTTSIQSYASIANITEYVG